jgi:hypothetical protein
MKSLGKQNEYESAIMVQIAEKIREMEDIQKEKMLKSKSTLH